MKKFGFLSFMLFVAFALCAGCAGNDSGLPPTPVNNQQFQLSPTWTPVPPPAPPELPETYGTATIRVAAYSKAELYSVQTGKSILVEASLYQKNDSALGPEYSITASPFLSTTFDGIGYLGPITRRSDEEASPMTTRDFTYQGKTYPISVRLLSTNEVEVTFPDFLTVMP